MNPDSAAIPSLDRSPSSAIAASLIVPTHRRTRSLLRLIKALQKQDIPAENWELVLVFDACNRRSVERIRQAGQNLPVPVRCLRHTARNAAASRNLGAEAARGECLIFLDDDMEPVSGFLRQHLRRRIRRAVRMGYSKPRPIRNPTWWQLNAQLWWEDRFSEMRRPEHRFSYLDMMSGNFSINRDFFQSVGGFDASISGRLEDYELGIRLIKNGARFEYSSGAQAWHEDRCDLPLWLKRLTHEGRAHFRICALHPELTTSIFSLEESPEFRLRWMKKLAFLHRRWAAWPAHTLITWCRILERCRLRAGWLKTLAMLREYHYWNGVASACGSLTRLEAMLQDGNARPINRPLPATLDLKGLQNYRLDPKTVQKARNAGLQLNLGTIPLGGIELQPGFEPVRANHVHGFLRNAIASRFIPELTLAELHHTLAKSETDADPNTRTGS